MLGIYKDYMRYAYYREPESHLMVRNWYEEFRYTLTCGGIFVVDSLKEELARFRIRRLLRESNEYTYFDNFLWSIGIAPQEYFKTDVVDHVDEILELFGEYSGKSHSGIRSILCFDREGGVNLQKRGDIIYRSFCGRDMISWLDSLLIREDV